MTPNEITGMISSNKHSVEKGGEVGEALGEGVSAAITGRLMCLIRAARA